MTDTELLNEIKTGLNITGTYQDKTLSLYIDEVKNFLIDAGVSEEIINSSVSVGVITRGVSDLWNYGMGTANLSDYFMQRAFQLKYAKIPLVLGELKIESSPGTTIGFTKITVDGQSQDAIFKIKITPSAIVEPEYDEDLSDWDSWDGVSEIEAEDGHKTYVAEVTLENLARSIGDTIAVVRLI